MKRSHWKRDRPPAPKKTITIVNPEFAEYQQQYGKENLIHEIHTGAALLLSDRSNPFAAYTAAKAEEESYFPEDFGSDIPEEGCWVLVKTPPCTEIRISKFSIWYALPVVRPQSNGFSLHLAKILTPDGDLCLWPHEYVKVDVAKYMEFIGQGFEINYFGEAAEIHTDSLFYLMSRGVTRPAALQLLLPSLQSQTVCWLEACEEVQAYF